MTSIEPRQQINQLSRKLETQDQVVRELGRNGKIVNKALQDG
jgi:hypothetical protein